MRQHGFEGDGVGIDFLLFRFGPVWTIGYHFRIAASGVAVIEETGPQLRPEARGEIEPHIVWSIWRIHFDDRNRLESRWFPGRHAWRYSNQLRLSYPCVPT